MTLISKSYLIILCILLLHELKQLSNAVTNPELQEDLILDQKPS